jgi:hypothetical protein
VPGPRLEGGGAKVLWLKLLTISIALWGA